MNRKVYLISALFILASIAIMSAKVIYGGQNVRIEGDRHLWNIHIYMHITGSGGRAKVRLTLPRDNERQTIYNEHFENDELVFYIRDREITGNRIGFWRSELLDGSKLIHYTFSAQLKSLKYTLPPQLEIPKNPLQFYPSEYHTWLDASKFIQSEIRPLKERLKKVLGREKKTAVVVRKIYDFVSGEVKYRSEKGSKSARNTLEQLVADCGGQARLFAAMSRAAGIPSRIVGGIILTGGVKNTTHVWTENYIDGQWIPFDTVNGHFASVPNHYLELYRGDYVLVKYIGLKNFEYFFTIRTERFPPVDNPWSLYVLPIHFQSIIKVLLLIPVGALVVSLFRSLVGVQTFGTFTPILLALAFREISLWIGLICVTTIVALGCLLRSALDFLKILVIPRLSLIVTMVVLFVVIFMIVGFHIGEQRFLYISLFPMVIMTWLIERFSVLQIEDGTKTALKAALGTTVVAVAAYYVMESYALRSFLFAFPEALLMIMGILLILGRYTGIRATELWRFKEFREAQKKLHQKLSRQ